ncbi:MAG: ribonuclease P protein component 1 [Candidatus Aenigmarchaeota archaeon]|nr:ribonuclease P protein component 1 [Candidatus Aenigmarchaeota archaeon]
MKRTPENLVRHEIVGLDVVVTASLNPSVKGLGGRVIDETRNTITIETDKKVRKIIKEECAFSFSIPGSGTVEIDGKELAGRPEDRIKKR